MFDAVFADGLERGLEQGMAASREQQRTMLAHQTARKFGQGAANRLHAFLAGVDDPERFAEIGGLLIDSADGEGFLSRAASSVERR